MSSLKRAMKSKQRLHKERHQPESRKQFGYLEKKQDYKARANDYQKKQNAYKLLRQKVLDNSEEFDFHMIKSQLKDGVHYEIRDDDRELTKDELKLMQTQDISYVQQKRVIEMKKIDKLKQTLHLIDCEKRTKNQHIFFVDNKSDKKSFDFEKRLKTSKELLQMGFNFANSDELSAQKVTERDVQNVAHLRDKSYKELAKRMERLNFLDILYHKMDVKKKLLNKKESKPKLVKKGTATKAPQFMWKAERKR